MGNVTHDLKRLGFGILLLLFAGLGIVASFAAAKYGIVDSQPLFIISGILNLVVVIYAAIKFFKNHLKY